MNPTRRSTWDDPTFAEHVAGRGATSPPSPATCSTNRASVLVTPTPDYLRDRRCAGTDALREAYAGTRGVA